MEIMWNTQPVDVPLFVSCSPVVLARSINSCLNTRNAFSGLDPCLAFIFDQYRADVQGNPARASESTSLSWLAKILNFGVARYFVTLL